MTKPEEQDDGKQGEGAKPEINAEGVALPMNLIKSLRRKAAKNGSDDGSSTSNAEGNNSDNSALVSLGNTSFGFNFDSEEGNSSPPNSERNGESDSDSGKGNAGTKGRHHHSRHYHSSHHQSQKRKSPESDNSAKIPANVPQHKQNVASKSSSSLTNDLTSSGSGFSTDGAGANSAAQAHNKAADEAVANLQTIANAYMSKEEEDNKERKARAEKETEERQENESNSGYNTDDEGARGFNRGSLKHTRNPEDVASCVTNNNSADGTNNDNTCDETSSITPSQASTNADTNERPTKKKKLNEKKREERNAREKERSFKISKQINEIQNLLSTGGVIVPKGTKSSVLTEAANYIRMLQQHHYRSELDRHQLVQQIQMIGGGAHGPQAAQAIRHVAAQNGVWSLGNFGGVPPKSAMSYYKDGNNGSGDSDEIQLPVDPAQQTKIEDHEYRSVFSNCAVGMAIASMGGAFIDCNQLFCQLSNYTKQEVCSLTIFNMTARQDLQHAFDLISQIISPPMDSQNSGPPQPILLRGAMNNRNDLGLGVALVKGDDGVAKFFCVTLIKNPASPFDDSKPIPATIELIQSTPSLTKQVAKDGTGLDSTPAFTTG